MDTRETPSPTAPNKPDEDNRTARSAVVNSLGVITGLVGTLFALVTLSTPPLKIAGTLVCVAVGVLILQVAHDRDRGLVSNRLLMWLSLAGVSTLVLVVLLANQPDASSNQERKADTSAAGRVSLTPTTNDTMSEPTTSASETTPWSSTSSGSSSAIETPTSLADLQRVESDRPDVDPWMTKSVQVKGVSYDKALVAEEFWCGSTQIDYVVGGQYSRLTATVGIADDSPRTEPLNFYILADEKRIKTVSDVRIAAPQAVDVPIEGVTRLAIGIESPITPDDKSGGDCPGTERTGAWIDPLLLPVEAT